MFLKVTDMQYFWLQKLATQLTIALRMGFAPSAMQFIIIFASVCLATLVMAISATKHHHTMRQVMEVHQLPSVCLESVGVRPDTSFRTIPVWERKNSQHKALQMETHNVITILKNLS
jgi:hypothetical protein